MTQPRRLAPYIITASLLVLAAGALASQPAFGQKSCAEICIANFTTAGNRVGGQIFLGGRALSQSNVTVLLDGRYSALLHADRYGHFSAYAPPELGQNELVFRSGNHTVSLPVGYYGDYSGFSLVVAGVLACLAIKLVSDFWASKGSVRLRFDGQEGRARLVRIGKGRIADAINEVRGLNDDKRIAKGLPIAIGEVADLILAEFGSIGQLEGICLREELSLQIKRLTRSGKMLRYGEFLSDSGDPARNIAALRIYQESVLRGKYELGGTDGELLWRNRVFPINDFVPEAVRGGRPFFEQQNSIFICGARQYARLKCMASGCYALNSLLLLGICDGSIRCEHV